MKLSKILLIIIPLAVIALELGPIGNLLYVREPVKIAVHDRQFATFSKSLQTSCADCHTPGATIMPLYTNLPIAENIVRNDIAAARTAFIISSKNLSGEIPFTAAQLNKIRSVVADGSMPPMRYVVMHWNAYVAGDEEKALLEWINKQNPDFGFAPIPKTNPFEPNAAKVALGHKLFNDKKLSADNTISCASCHSFKKGGADGLIVATGIEGKQGKINTPTVFNAAFNFAQFWDGRAVDLKDQVHGPLTNPVEMGSNWKQVAGKLNKDPQYIRDFAAIYASGKNKSAANLITGECIADAISNYEQTLLTRNSRFDKFLQGDRNSILTVDEQSGYKLFIANNCVSCHAGINFGGQSFELMGKKKNYFKWRGHITASDNGRFNVTHDPADLYKFKVPTLRNIALTAPYFHDGYADDLYTAVKIMAEYQVGQPLSDKDAYLIVKFLNTLTGEYDGKSI